MGSRVLGDRRRRRYRRIRDSCAYVNEYPPPDAEAWLREARQCHGASHPIASP